jgi:menaquinone-dependent protoporphyrinogen IX oxidase
MSKIFIYYSQSGQTASLVPFFKEKGYDILALETLKPITKIGFFKMIHYGGRATFHKTEKLKPYLFDEKQYETIVVGSPIWADRLATPINSFLKEHPLTGKKPLFVLVSGGGESSKAKKDVLKLINDATFVDLKTPGKIPSEVAKISAKLH